MALTTEQLLKAVKLDGKTFETEEDFVAELSKQYAPIDAPISEEKKAKVIGGLLGTLETTLKRELKEFGVEHEIDKKKPIQDTLAEVMAAIRTTKNEEFEALKAQSGTGNDEKIKSLTSELEKFKNKFHEEKDLRTQAVAQWQQKEQEYEGKIKNVKKDYKLTDTYSSAVKWKSGITEIEKIGFDSMIKSKYNVDLDEADALIVTDKQGKQIPNPKVAGQTLSFAEVLEMEGTALKVWEVNPHANKNQQAAPQRAQPVIVQTPDQQGGRKVAPRVNVKA